MSLFLYYLLLSYFPYEQLYPISATPCSLGRPHGVPDVLESTYIFTFTQECATGATLRCKLTVHCAEACPHTGQPAILGTSVVSDGGRFLLATGPVRLMHVLVLR